MYTSFFKTPARYKEILYVGRNQWQGIFSKEAEFADTITINITVFDLYVKKQE